MHPELRELATRQAGCFSAIQASPFHSRRVLARWVSAGVLVPVRRGWFGVGEVDPVTALRRLHTAGSTPVIACLGTAAQLHGFGVLERAPGTVHLTTPAAVSGRAPWGVVLHQMSLRSAAVEVDGMLATDPGDTAVDVACGARPRDVLVVLDAALRTGLSMPDLSAAVDRGARLRGIIAVRTLLPFASPQAESPMESRTRFVLLQAGLPRPDLQVVVPTRDGARRRVDLGWRGLRVGVEFDGEEFHTGDGSLHRDRQRLRELADAGWRLVHATASDIYGDAAPFLSSVRRAIGPAAFLPPPDDQKLIMTLPRRVPGDTPGPRRRAS